MRPRAPFAPAALPLIALSLAACQTNAVDPSAPAGPANTLPPALASVPDPNSFGFSVADLTIDLATHSATLTPVRSASAIGDDYSELGLTPAFNKTFGDNFQVVGLRTPSPGLVEVDVQITHPFSPATRPDLGIFNVKCFVVTDRAPVGLDGVNIAPDVLNNADGYSDTWQLTHPASIPTFGPANVQPYVILREDPSSAPFDFQNPAGWNVLFPGQTSTDTLAISIASAATFQARLFLTADYGQSAVRATRQTPDYQLPKFAGNAPWKIEVTELTNDLEETDLGSTATYDVTIWDWKHGQSLGSDVIGATISVPGVTTAPVNLSLSGTGTDPTPLIATPLITNAAGAVEGDYIGIVTVNDAGQGVGLEENLTTPVSFGSYTTYMTFPVHVDNTVVVVPPTAAITRCIGGDLGTGITETFDASTSIAGSAPITAYEWDFDYDGSNFTADATGITATHAFTVPGTPTVALRVSDGSIPGTDLETTIMAINPIPSWKSATRVTNNAFWDRFESISELVNATAVTPDGTVHVVYHDVGSSPAFDYAMFHQTLPECQSTWTAPVIIHTLPNQIFRHTSLTVTPSGTLHASGAIDFNEFGSSSFNGSTWSPMIPITTNVGSGYWGNGQLATNGANEVGFLTIREAPFIGGTPTDGIIEPPSNIYFSELIAGAWTPLILVGNMNHKLNHSQGLTPSLTLEGTAGTEWVACWTDLKTQFLGTGTVSSASNSEWTRTVAGAWQLSALNYTALTNYDRTILRRAPNGNLFYLTANNNQINLSIYDGTTWGTMSTVHALTSGSPHYHLNFSAPGEGMMSIASSTNAGGTIAAKRFQQADSLATIAGIVPMTVSPAGLGVFRQWFPQMQSLGAGRWICVWSDERYGAWADGLELESSFFQ